MSAARAVHEAATTLQPTALAAASTSTSGQTAGPSADKPAAGTEDRTRSVSWDGRRPATWKPRSHATAQRSASEDSALAAKLADFVAKRFSWLRQGMFSGFSPVWDYD